MKVNYLSKCLCMSLSTAMLTMTAFNGYAEETSEQKISDTSNVERISILGSRIKRVAAEGATPVTQISAAEIALSGATSVADALQRSTLNSFGAAGGGANSGWSSQQTINLRGAGINHTLVLLDGQRMGKSAVLNGGAVNMNAIPASAIERIDILSAGASAVYGSDAMAGVINVVLKKNYEGLELSASNEYNSGSYEGGETNIISMAGGISGDKGNLTFSLEHKELAPIFQRQRPYLGPQTSSNSRNMQDASNNWRLQSYTENPADCANAYNDPSSNITAFLNPEGSPLCRFDYSTLAGAQSNVMIDSAMFNFNYDLTDSIVFQARSLVSRSSVKDVSAPSFGWFEFENPLPATVYNDIAMNEIEAGDWGNYRLWQNGNRVSDQQDIQSDTYIGLEGNNDSFDWYASFVYARSSRNAFGTGFANTNALITGEWINDTSHPDYVGMNDKGYAVNADGYALGHVDGWDPRDPNSLPPAASKANFDRKDEYVSQEFSIGATFPIMELDGGEAQVATGISREKQSFTGLVDGQGDAGITSGGYGSSIGEHDRTINAAFVELYFPVIDNLEINIAGRHDDYSDFGTTTNLMTNMIWRPMENIAIRGNFGQGFLAPDSRQQHAKRSETWYNINDALSGDALIERKHYNYGNESLKPEESISYGVGLSWDINDNFGFGIDYSVLNIKNKFYQMSGSDMTRFYAEAPSGTEIWDEFEVGKVYRNSVATPIDPNYTSRGAIHTPIVNFGEDSNEFIDINILATFGGFNAKLIWSHLLKNEVESFVGRNNESGWLGKPEDRINLHMAYALDDHSINWTTWYIGSQTSFDQNVDSHMEHNLSYNYQSPWNMNFSLGVRNLTNEDPEFVDDTTNYNSSLYSIKGRRIVASVTVTFN